MVPDMTLCDAKAGIILGYGVLLISLLSALVILIHINTQVRISRSMCKMCARDKDSQREPRVAKGSQGESSLIILGNKQRINKCLYFPRYCT